MTDALVFECDLDAPPEKVWRAIATPELREAWLGEPEAGPSEVTRAEPGERLDILWPTRDGETLVSFEIADLGGLVKLTVIHDRFEADSLVLATISQGWPHILSNLKTLLETGEVLPTPA